MRLLRINTFLFFIFLLSGFLCSCQSELKSISSVPATTQKPSIEFLAIDLDGLRIESDSSVAYYLHKRDLLKEITRSDELYLYGSPPENSRILSHPFMGTFAVATKNDSIFRVQGKLFKKEICLVSTIWSGSFIGYGSNQRRLLMLLHKVRYNFFFPIDSFR